MYITYFIIGIIWSKRMAFERLIRAAKGYLYHLRLLKENNLSVYFSNIYVFKYRNHVIMAFYFGPTILLFSPIFLLVFQKISHLYILLFGTVVYSELKSTQVYESLLRVSVTLWLNSKLGSFHLYLFKSRF